jgi:hypothetical protein
MTTPGQRVLYRNGERPTAWVGTVLGESYRNLLGSQVVLVRWEHDGFTSEQVEFVDEIITTDLPDA